MDEIRQAAAGDVVFAFVYNLAYDHIFPIPEGKAKPAAVTCLTKAGWPQEGQTFNGASDIFCNTSLAKPQWLHL